MATDNYRRPSCGESFSAFSTGYTDHSDMLPDDTGLTAGESMSAGNTINRPTSMMSAPGSLPVNPPPPGAEIDDPALDIPGRKGATVMVNSSGKKVGDSYG